MKAGGTRLKGIEKQSCPGEPLVSIITVVLNGEKHLEQTICSVLEQDYKNIEYIIIDGGSTDSTPDIIKRYEDRIDLWQSGRDGGIYFAMNKGIALAKGELIGIINADDFYKPGAIRKVVEADAEHHASVYYGDMELVQEPLLTMKPDITKMDEMPAIFHPTCFVKRSVYEQAGAFDTQYRISADYDFLLRCIRKGYAFHYVPATLTAFRPGGMSASCASNIEGYRIMKTHQTGYHRSVVWRAMKCYVKTFVKKIIHLRK